MKIAVSDYLRVPALFAFGGTGAVWLFLYERKPVASYWVFLYLACLLFLAVLLWRGRLKRNVILSAWVSLVMWLLLGVPFAIDSLVGERDFTSVGFTVLSAWGAFDALWIILDKKVRT